MTCRRYRPALPSPLPAKWRRVIAVDAQADAALEQLEAAKRGSRSRPAGTGDPAQPQAAHPLEGDPPEGV
jgi:hypothetical protein